MFYQLSEQVTILVVKLKGMFLILGGKAALSQKLCFKSNHYSTSTGVKLAVSKLLRGQIGYIGSSDVPLLPF